jgi:hypothetical protein
LGLAVDPRYALADIDRGFLIFVEKMWVETYLPVGNRDQVGRDVGADVAGLGLGNRQGGQRPATLLRRELGGALQQVRMNLEDVAGIGFAPGRPAQQQRYLPICRRIAWSNRR